MYPLSKPVTPAVKSHMEAQMSLYIDMSKKMFNSLKRINELNVQVAQKLMEESVSSSHQLLATDDVSGFLSIVASQAQPAAEKVRAYQQHLRNIAADMQVDLAKSAEQHIPETSRTAAALADEVAKSVTKETEKVTQHQQIVLDKISSTTGMESDETLRQVSRTAASKAANGAHASGKSS